MTTVVHCKKHPYDQYIGRPFKNGFWGYGNPFVIGADGNRTEVIKKWKVWLDTGENFNNKDATEPRRQWILNNLYKLKDKCLGCWCKTKPEIECHGDDLKERVDKL
jgi:hypothetical protein